MRAKEFIIEGYKEVIQKFSQQVDKNTVTDTVNKFKELVSKNQIKDTNEKNIDYWGKQPFEKFKEFVDSKSQSSTSTQVKRKKVAGKSITLKEDDQWLIVIPLDKEASCFHGKDTDWCTTKPTQSYYEDYFYDKGVTLIYCLQKQTGNKWAMVIHKDLEENEFFNKIDDPINSNQFDKETGLNHQELKKLALTHNDKIQKTRDKYNEAMQYLENIEYFNIKSRDEQLEKILLFTKDSGFITNYVIGIFQNAPEQLQQVPDIILRIGGSDFPPILQHITNKSPDFYKHILKINRQASEYINKTELNRIEIAKLVYYRTIQRVYKSFAFHQPYENPLKDVPEHVLTLEDYIAFATNITFPYEFLQFIPEKFRTLDVCKIAYDKDPRNLKHCPDNIKFKIENEPVFDYLRTDGKNPDTMSTHDIRDYLIKKNLNFIQDKSKHEQVYNQLINNSLVTPTDLLSALQKQEQKHQDNI